MLPGENKRKKWRKKVTTSSNQESGGIVQENLCNSCNLLEAFNRETDSAENRIEKQGFIDQKFSSVFMVLVLF